MTLIKADPQALTEVRPFRARPLGGEGPAPAARRDHGLQRLEAQIEALSAELDRAREEAATLREAADQAYLDGELTGREEGRQLAQTREDDRLVAVREAADAAGARFEEALAGLEALAIQMAGAALEKVLGDPGEYAALTKRIVHRQAAALREGGVVRVEVSADDFSPAALSEAFADVGWLHVTAATGLSPGECRLKLVLGELDVGVPRQWEALRALLDRVAEEERRA